MMPCLLCRAQYNQHQVVQVAKAKTPHLIIPSRQPPMPTPSKRLPLIAFGILGLIWGSNFIYMKMAAHSISPLQIVFFRVLCGFVPVLLYAFFSGALKTAHIKHLPHFIVMALLATDVYYFCYATGAHMLPSGIAGALSGAIPLFSFALSMIFLAEEKTTALKSIGVALGFLGVLLIGGIFEQNLSASNSQGVIYMALGSLSVGSSFVYAKKFISPLNIPAAALTTYQLGIGLLILSIVTPFTGINAIWSDTHAAIGLVVGLGLLGTGLAYILYYFIVSQLGAVAAASSTYIPPVIALLIGVLIVGEHITTVDVIGAGLILMGVVLINKRVKPHG